MQKKKIRNRILLFLLLTLVFLSQSTEARAERWHRERFRRHRFYVHHPYPGYGRFEFALPAGFVEFGVGGSSYYYYDGIFYRRFKNRYVVVPAPIGAVVTAIPADCRTVVIGGATYYTRGGVYYRYTTYGYEVVPEPRVIVVRNATVYPGTSPTPILRDKEKLGLSDIIVLSKAGVNDDVIIEKIIKTGAVFNLSAEEVIAMRKEGVSSRIINFMLQTAR